MLKKLLLFIVVLASYSFTAQTLYWVGGSGNWNDGHHWSQTSGGTPANRAPDMNTDVVFDNNSSSNTFKVNFVGLSYAKSAAFLNQNNELHFTGSNLTNLRCSGNFVLNNKTFYEANTFLIFSSISPQYHNVHFWKNSIKANVLFEDGNWNLQSVKLDDNYLLKINRGNYKVLNTSIIAGNLESVSDNVIFQTTHSTIYIKNRVVLGNKVSFNSSDLVFFAQKNNPALFKIDAAVNLGQNSKIYNANPSPQACAITYSFTSPSCNGSCDASITIGFDAGCTAINGPYDILFNNGSGCFPPGVNGILPPTFMLDSLCSCGGLLDIFVSDSIGLVASLTGLSTPQDPTPLNMTFSGTKQPRCFGLCDGSVNVFNSGGNPPYSITILASPSGTTVATYTNIPAVSTTTISGLCAGTFSFVVKDANNCTRTFTRTMTQPTPVNPNALPANISCNSVCNGSVSTTASGGVGPYTYSWVSASTTPSLATTSSYGNLCPGVVTLTVTDTKTCTATYSTTITQPPAITLTVTKTNLICGSLCDGTASITATGGVGGFTYSWTPNVSTTFSATALCAGPYTVTVADNLNCAKTVTFNLTAPLTLTATATQTNLACNSDCIGAIRLTASGGTGAYSYAWSPPAISSTSVASTLCAGPYTFTVTDNVNCTYINTVTITQPPAVTLTVNSTNVTCFGACNGTATGSPNGGTGAYTFSWSPSPPPLPGQGTATITSLCPGTYTLRATDANGCFRIGTVSVTEPPVIAANVTSVSPTCNGICNGSINSVPTGGTGPYTFTLQPSVGAPITGLPPFTGLCAGNYTLSIKDFLNCIRTQTINFTQPNPINLSLSATALNCFNQCNSTISALIAGGTPTYTVNWNVGGPGTSITGQCAGVHTATVTDSQGCQATASINITSPPDMTVTITAVNPNCNAQCTGIATATVTGGTPNYTYVWSNGPIVNVNPNLCAGNYTVTATDFMGCIKTQTIAIITPPALTLTTVSGSVSCAGTCDGTVSVTASGGTSPYFYNWNPSAQTTSVAVSLCPGNYIVSVTDTKGCLASATASVSQPAVLTTSISNVQPSCNICIGAATASGVGGTGPYTYSWSPGNQTVSTPTNLCVGTQTVRVTDSRGCSSTQTVQINQTINIAVTTNSNVLTCNGVCSGVATANATGGTGTYQYTWTPAPVQTTQTATGLCAGSHTVLVVDGNGCSNTNVVAFTNPPAITLTVNQTNVTCNGLCNGSANANATGGTGVKTYSWSNGATTPSVNGLCAGIYTVMATDANNCVQTRTVTITQSSALTATFTSNNPSGCNLTDGSISFVPGGGVTPYTFTWTPGPSTNPKTNLGDGTYILNLSDANGCSQSFTTTLSDPLSPTVTVTSNSLVCFGSCVGSASLSVISATPTFSVVWSAPIPPTNTSTTASSLCAGNYVATVTDANSCVTNQTVNIAQPTQISSTGTVTNINCNAACIGSINITSTGGNGAYSYTWSPAGGNVEDPSNLCATNYSVIIADANNCSVTNTYVITQPAGITLSFNKRDVLCNGGCTGAVRAVVGGGSLPFSYTWTPVGSFSGSNIDTIVNLCSGIYTVNVRDANGCTISGTVSIGEPTALTSTLTKTNVKCNGQCNGTAAINPTGGTLPYSFSYNTTPPTPSPTITTLCVGTYTGIVTDANGCSSSNGFVITEPLPIVITTTVSNPKCNAVCNGSVATTVTGGNSPTYQYSWLFAGGSVANPTGLCAGNYTVTVTDDSLCTNQAVVSLIEPAALIASTSFTNPTCNTGCNGIVTANPIGGTVPFSYLWSSTPTNTNQTVSGLCAGSYTVIVSDLNSCRDTQMVTLVAPPAISVNPGLSPANCGVSNGSIVAPVTGGVPNYTYNWLNPILASQATNSVVIGIPAGVYTVVVTDAVACSSTVSIFLSDADGPTGATITTTNVACNGQCNGAAAISNPVGGTPSYTLSWANPVSTNTLITNLCDGIYTAQIKDSNGCLFFQADTIAEPQLIDDNEIINSALCFGNCNGSIALNPTGGNGGYTYLWTPSATTGTITNLCPGVYTSTITDNLGCTFTASYNLPSLTSITSNTVTTNNICFNNCNGTLLVTNVAGGLPPYSYNWSDPLGQSTALATGLCNGNYSVTVRDANGCFNQMPGTVTSPSQITFTPTVTQPGCGLCDGAATINLIGGTPSYSLIWSNSQTGTSLTNLCAGVYMVQITDGNGCVSDSNIIINSSSTITGEIITKTDVSCSGVCDGSVTVTAVGGTNPITYNWVHNNSNSQSLTGLCSGTYFCNMTDSSGCIRTASVVIGSITTLTISSQVTQSSCSSSTGSITVNATGGTGSYTYAWLPLGTGNTATVTALAPGSYTLNVSDGICSRTQVYSLNSVNAPVINFTKKDISCGVVCDGNIALTITGGSPGYTTLWSNGLSTPTIINLCAGSYSVRVTDGAGCTAVQNFSLNALSPIVFSTPDVNNVLCSYTCDGSITSIPTGGSLPYTFSWTPVAPSAPTTSSLCPGNYSITVSDVNGCFGSQTYTISSPPALTLTAIVTTPSCSTLPDGAIDITVSGGTSTPPYTYSWAPTGAPTQDLINILAGTYSVSITDGNGCKKDSSFIINSTITVDAVAGNDTLFCQNGTLLLNGSNSNSGAGTTYQWLSLPTNSLVSGSLITSVSPATGTSTYVLVATDAGGTCIDRDSVVVTSNPLPIVDAGPMVSMPVYSSAIIGGSPTGPIGSTFSWSPIIGLDNPTSTNPISGTTVTTIYTVTVVGVNGCSNSDTVTVYVYPEVMIPNGFSPNGDGKNDVWQIDYIDQFPNCEVEVYNRWGEQLFYSKGYTVPFNGQYKGKDLPVGTYYYIINLNHPSFPDAYTSPLTIFR